MRSFIACIKGGVIALSFYSLTVLCRVNMTFRFM
jgi:hypothetical protein